MLHAKTNDLSAFGAYAPHGLLRFLIGLTRCQSANWLGKRTAFILRAIATRTLAGRPVDIQTLGANMRLYPFNNVCEKRILFTPQYFDAAEINYLRQKITPDFVFVDIGANVGGYALCVAAMAGPKARILALEPQPEIFERLVYNIRQNSFATIKALDCAVADKEGEITLFIAPGNRGETSMRLVHSDVSAEQMRVQARPLAALLKEEGLERIDAIKLDVEGAEDIILDAFLHDAPQAVWPKMFMIEKSPSRWAIDLFGLLKRHGYVEKLVTKLNVIWEKA